APDELGEAEAGQEGQPRDNLGRFASRPAEAEPGEAEGSQPSQPRDEQQAPDGAKPVPPAPDDGRSREPPQHWPEHDRHLFARQTPEAQEWLLRRHTEM